MWRFVYSTSSSAIGGWFSHICCDDHHHICLFFLFFAKIAHETRIACAYLSLSLFFSCGFVVCSSSSLYLFDFEHVKNHSKHDRWCCGDGQGNGFFFVCVPVVRIPAGSVMMALNIHGKPQASA